MKRPTNPAPAPAKPKEIQVLRAQLDERLTILEAALADPNQHGELEQIILDLARLATEEADAAARKAYLDGQRESEGAIAASRAEGLTELETERESAGSLRRELGQAEAGLKEERAVRVARERELEAERESAASLRRELGQAEAGLKEERAARVTRERELDAARKALEQEQTARASLSRQFEDARAALESERAAANAIREHLEQAQAESREAQAARQHAESGLQQAEAARQRAEAAQQQAESARQQAEAAQQQAETARQQAEAAYRQAEDARQSENAAAISRARDLAAVQQALEQELRQEQASREPLRHQLEEAQTATAAIQQSLEQALEQAQAALQSEQAAGAGRERNLVAVQQELTRELEREQAAHARLRQELESTRGAADADRVNRQEDLERRLADAEEQAQAAIRDQQSLLEQFDEVKRTAAAAAEDAQTRYVKLRDANEQKIRSLQLAVSEADERATAAERDFKAQQLEMQARQIILESTPAPFDSSLPPGAPPMAAAPAAVPAAGAPPGGPVRTAKRVAMGGEVDIQIDGNPSMLIDLSTTGAQILSPGALKPNRHVTITLPMDDGSRISCKGKVMWSRLETGRGGGQLWYRAGVSFTSVNQAAVEEYLKSKK